MARWLLPVSAVMMALAGACGSGQPGPADTGDTAAHDPELDTSVANVAPSAPQVVISPVSPLTGDELAATLLVPATDPDGPASLTYSYVWTRDGVDQADSGERVPAARTARGQRWSVRVRAHDGAAQGPAGQAPAITIGDTPATLAGATLDASEVSPLETLTCTPIGFVDPDGDPEAVRVRWLQPDGAAQLLLAEGATTFIPASLALGDRVLCELTPLSAGAPGAPVTSPAATIVAPTAPVVTLTAPDGAAGPARCDVTTPATHVGAAATTTTYWRTNGGDEVAGAATRDGLADCDVLACRVEVAAGAVTLSSAAATLALPLGPACDAVAACHAPRCAPGGGCGVEPLSGTACASAGPCLGPGVCASGTCEPGSAPANDGTSCDDGDPCTTGDVCVGALCAGGAPAADGTACDDGDGCTLADTCAAGACLGGPAVDCAAAGGSCAVASCHSDSPDGYLCIAEDRPAGSSCSEPEICTVEAYCDGEGACLAGTPPAVTDARILHIDIGAHPLDTVNDAIWDVIVARADAPGEPLLATRVSSAQCGAGGSAASVAAACDAAGAGEVVTARLKGLYSAPVAAPGRFGDPVPAGGMDFADPGDLVRTVQCLDAPATGVAYDVSLARPAEGGFFTKSVNFDQIYCSANFTCCDDSDDDGDCDADIDLLFAADGQRATTFKLGFACAAETSANMDLRLYMDDLVLTCDGVNAVAVNPESGDGNLCAPGQVGSCDPKVTVTGSGASYLFQAAVYRGESSFSGVDRVWWNLALGVNKAALAAADCQLTTRATADTHAVAGGAQDGTIVAPAVYPYIVWDVNISDAAGVACAEHGVGDTPDVYPTYTDDSATTDTVFQRGQLP